MPLINCPDCNTECSDMAPACPKCGRPLGGQKSLASKDLGFGGFIYALMVVIGLVLIVTQGGPFGWLLAGAGGLLLAARLTIWTGVERK